MPTTSRITEIRRRIATLRAELREHPPAPEHLLHFDIVTSYELVSILDALAEELELQQITYGRAEHSLKTNFPQAPPAETPAGVYLDKEGSQV